MRRCPICKNVAERRDDDRWAPFCSERCKLIDLGNWLGEGYRVPDDERHSPDDERLNRGRAARDDRASKRRGRR